MRNTVLRLALGAVLLTMVASTAQASTWKIDPAHSLLQFKIRHLFSKTGGQFDKWEGTIEFDPEDPSQGSVTLKIDAASINTDNEERDEHLRSEAFFEVEKYPTITFKSTKVVAADDGYLLHGDLSMHGVTRPVVIPFQFDGSGKDPWGNVRAGFSGNLKLDRKEYGMVWNAKLDQGGVVLGDEVSIEIEIEAIQEPAGR